MLVLVPLLVLLSTTTHIDNLRTYRNAVTLATCQVFTNFLSLRTSLPPLSNHAVDITVPFATASL